MRKGVISLTGNSDQSHTICGSDEVKPKRKGRSSSIGIFAEHMRQLPFLDPLASPGPMSNSHRWAVNGNDSVTSGLERLIANARASRPLSFWFGSYWWAILILKANLPAGPLKGVTLTEECLHHPPPLVTHHGCVGRARNGFEPVRFGAYCYYSKTCPVLNEHVPRPMILKEVSQSGRKCLPYYRFCFFPWVNSCLGCLISQNPLNHVGHV